MSKFEDEYKKLNAEQRKAVDAIEGPVLVVAGPGTGKTQLLSLRVANIIKQTDTAPANILCLTFTDSAARNMRERLEIIIGQAAYHVNVHTFHSFGVEIINQYPDFFLDRQLLQQIDELGSYQLLREIFEQLPYSNPLSTKVGDEYIMLKDTLSIIGWLKQNALTPNEFHDIINHNQICMAALADIVAQTFSDRPSPKKLRDYRQLLKQVKSQVSGKMQYGFPEYAAQCAAELSEAIEGTDPSGRYAPKITEWRNRWCEKNAKGNHVFKDAGRNIRKLHAVANIYKRLLELMRQRGLYDFDDMIVESVHALEKYDELRANLQERYLYVLVDEFQDTNKAQFRILQALSDSPIFEGRPNIMAVGDDDQAIYAFQGAEVSNIVAFTESYNDPTVVALTDNYRSTATILNASLTVASQISDRLEAVFPDTHKKLQSKTNYKTGLVAHNVLPSELAQYQWLAEQIEEHISTGTRPEEIAVIAPRHRYLERLVPYLAGRNIPISYERRENVLDAPLIHQLLTMAHLVVAIADNQHDDIDEILSEVISYEFWDIPPETLLEISITCYDKHVHWLPTLIKHKNKSLVVISKWFIQLARHSTTEPLEYVLDNLLGSSLERVDSEQDEPETRLKKSSFVSPMREYYFNKETYETATDTYLALLGQLSTLRQRLRQWKPSQPLYARDLIEFATLHTEAHLKIIDTNPHTQTTNAVQVMTAYKAKGLEFDIVFVINAQDEIWGPTSRSRSLRITLPKNLPLAPASDGDNDKLRLLFVALTRAKHTLMITSYTHTLENKLSPGLSFIGGNLTESEASHPSLKPVFIDKPANTKAVEILVTDWAYRFRHIIADKPTLFEPILKSYKLSVTHLNNFLDIVDGGPDYFFRHNLLRFPHALTPPAAYGDAIHRTLQWTHNSFRESGRLPKIADIQAFFVDMLTRKHLRRNDFIRLEKRGQEALSKYLTAKEKDYNSRDLVERGFNNEGVVVNDARLSGKIDKLHFLDSGNVEVVDFKTGKPASSWQGRDDYEKIKLYKYRQQLLFYKLLIEHSASFKDKVKVVQGALEFIEANEQNELVNNLQLEFAEDELERFSRLIGVIWKHILELDMPSTSSYEKNLRGIAKFEEDLLSGHI